MTQPRRQKPTNASKIDNFVVRMSVILLVGRVLICNEEEMRNMGTVALGFQAYGENP